MAYQHIGLKFGMNPRDAANVALYGKVDENLTACVQTDYGGYVDVAFNDWPHWVDNYPVCVELKMAVRELRLINPQLKFVPYKCKAQRTEAAGHLPNYAFRELWACVDACDFLLGRIGYGDFSINKDGPPKYMVFARGIKNSKLRDNREQYNMSFSTDVKRFAKTAATYLRPYTLQEYAHMDREKFVNDVRNRRDEVIGAADSLMRQCQTFDVLKTEMVNLIRLGVEFVTPQFKEVAANYLSLSADGHAEKMQKAGAYFVRIFNSTTSKGEQLAHVMSLDTINQVIMHTTPHTLYTEADLPDEIKFKIATLSSVADGTYIPNVGRRVRDNRYWIERQA